ncbi:uncharacterized protein B0H18DRAFT_1045239 [Fomitopsis serialis]|uniref:uncharacterized protein n=1 Tax=Fomitopsis serialis TaxID=139415 RepID=UPI0020085FD6|nr:uncharacterized protein B0H18DRAFT_1045239 [Neoantrodia serialis]KAH9914441.1 hypothetical protein B0H18DRAFT_1045239 [Neoantrodia serialis]
MENIRCARSESSQLSKGGGMHREGEEGIRQPAPEHTLKFVSSIPLPSTISMPSARTMSAGPFAITVRMKRELLGEASLH